MMQTGNTWLCKKCYDAIGHEVECYTDANFFGALCTRCSEGVGKYHVCNLEDMEDRHILLYGDGSPAPDMGTIHATLRNVADCFIELTKSTLRASQSEDEFAKSLPTETILKFRRYKMYRRRCERHAAN